MNRFTVQLRNPRLGVISLFLLFAASAFAQQTPPLPVIQQPAFRNDTLNIKDFGAKGDGIFMNTQSINNAIDACNKKGGGVVLIPTGLWSSGPIVLKSNVNLHLAYDAILLFSADFNQYKLVEGNWEGKPSWRNQSPISGTNLENIAITGGGIIDGNGAAWRMVKKEKLTASQWQKLVASGGIVGDNRMWYPSAKVVKGNQTKNAGAIVPGKTAADYEDIKDFLRPNLVVLTGCKKVLLEGVTFQNSPAWNLHPLLCEDLTLRKVQVKNPWYAQNGDGIDVESCKNVLIENSTFDVGDDGICIKSGRDEAGRKRGVPTENVIIRHNTVYHAHGGFVIGSEMSGGARNIWVSDCSFIGTDIGLRFKTTRGRGGIVENIFVDGVSMIDIPGEAILFDMYYAAQDPIPLAGEKREAIKAVVVPVTEATPQFRNFYIKNVTANGAAKAVFLRGLPEMNIKGIHLENITIQSDGGIECIEATDISFKNVKVISKKNNPLVNLHNSTRVNFNQLQFKPGSELLFNITGENTNAISVEGTDVAKAAKASAIAEGLKASVLQINK